MEWIKKIRQRTMFQNWISVLGEMSAIFWFVVIFSLFVVDTQFDGLNPYLITFGYIIAPVFLVAGLLMIPVGAWIEKRRRKSNAPVKDPFPKIDFNNPRHQKLAFSFIAITTFFVIFSIVGTYKAYEFTESPQFCGLLCHQVMEPEYTTYQHSPHARVACAECHVGHGPEHYVQAKIRGTQQMIDLFQGDYPRPIETPVKNLRPAQYTCETCHWPQAFYGSVEQNHEYFLPDKENSAWKMRMLVHVGGGKPAEGKGRGIHWHTNPENQVYYAAADDKRQEIPWVKVVGPDGSETVYVDQESGLTADAPPEGELRKMDCIDCHNRPTHRYEAPIVSVNELLQNNLVDRSLPYFKREAANLLSQEYESREEASEKIRAHFEKFYQEKYPEIWTKQQEQIKQAAERVIEIQRLNFFPHMKVSWRHYADNVGHFYSTGCFRCHDGKHQSEAGQVISSDCKLCHTIIAQGPPDAVESSVDGLEFKHPEDIEDMWKEMSCTECHNGSLT